MSTDLGKIEAAVRAEYGAIKDLKSKLVVEDFLQGAIYYCDFQYVDAKEEDDDEDFCYVFSGPTRVLLFDDGVEVIKELQTILDKRRNPWQRLSDFTLTEVIGAVIAIAVTIAFVVLSIARTEISKDFLGIFAIIAGYYFGKNTSHAK